MLDPVIRPIPSSDADFARAAEAALTELGGSEWADQRLGPALAAVLRPDYPNVVVRPMERLAGVVDELDVWYVFRDGDGHIDEALEPSNRSGSHSSRGSIDALMADWLAAERAIGVTSVGTADHAAAILVADAARERYQAAIDAREAVSLRD